MKAHQASVLYENEDVREVGAEWLVFTEKCSVPGHKLIRNCTLIPNGNLILFADSSMEMEPAPIPAFEIWKLGGWMLFSVDKYDADLLRELRSRISNLFLKFLNAVKLTDEEDRLIDVIVSIIEEDLIEKAISKIRAKALNDNQ